MEFFGIPEAVGAYNTVVQTPGIAQLTRQRVKRNLVANLGGGLVQIPDVVEGGAHTVRTDRIVHTAANAVFRFIQYPQELVFVVLVNIEVNLVVGADNREHVPSLISADRHIIGGITQIVEVDGAVVEVNPVVEFGGTAAFVVEAHHARQFVARGHITHHRVGGAEVGADQIGSVIAMGMTQYTRGGVVIPMQVVVSGGNVPIAGIGGKVLASIVAVLGQFNTDFIKRQHGNIYSVGIRTTITVGRTGQYKGTGRIHHTSPRESQVVALGQRIGSVRAGRQGHQSIIRFFYGIYRTGLGFKMVDYLYGLVVADGYIGNIGKPTVILTVRNEEEHAVKSRTSEGVGHFKNQPYAVALLVFFTQLIQRMDRVGIDEQTVATGNPVRFATDGGIGIEPVIGIVVDTVVLAGIRNNGTEHHMRRITYQGTVPCTTIPAERHHAELVLIGDVFADIPEILLGVTEQRLAIAVPLQVRFFHIEGNCPAGNGGFQYHFYVTVEIRASRINFGTDGYLKRIGGEYHQGGGIIVAYRIIGTRQAGFNPTDNIVVAAILLLLDVDKIQIRHVERYRITAIIHRGYQGTVYIPVVNRIGSTVGYIGDDAVILVGANRIHFQVKVNLNLGYGNGSHREFTRPNGRILRIAVFGLIHIQESLDMAAHRQVAFEGYGIGSTYQ